MLGHFDEIEARREADAMQREIVRAQEDGDDARLLDLVQRKVDLERRIRRDSIGTHVDRMLAHLEPKR